MAETALVEEALTPAKRSCVQEGFLPVPLASVPPDSLNGLEVYIATYPTYNLYKSKDLKFGTRDYSRLIDAGTSCVYITIKDHQKYYNAIEDSLSDIVSNKTIALNKKCEVLYATTIALTRELTSAPPEGKDIKKAVKLTENTINLVLKNPNAFQHLFNISNHDFYTATHASNVSIMLVSFAQKIGISDPAILNDLGTGGLLHDVGKVFVPTELLNSKERLSDDDFIIIKDHVSKGLRQLEEHADLSDFIMKLVAEHHEKMDGTGYPKGLRGEEISPQGRLIAAVDMFEAMTSVRPYRDTGMPISQAMDLIQDMAPEKLDQQIVNSFVQFIESSTNGNNCEISDQADMQILEALGINDNCLKNPSGRRHERYFFRVKTQIKLLYHKDKSLTYGNEYKVITHNISQSGVGFLSHRRFEKGQYVSLSITLPSQNKDINYFAKIVRVIDHADGWFTIGAEFVKMKSAEIIRDIYDELK